MLSQRNTATAQFTVTRLHPVGAAVGSGRVGGHWAVLMPWKEYRGQTSVGAVAPMDSPMIVSMMLSSVSSVSSVSSPTTTAPVSGAGVHGADMGARDA